MTDEKHPKPDKPPAAAEESLSDDLKRFRIGLDAAMAAYLDPSDPTSKVERLLTAGYTILRTKLPKPN